jgi:hypothetical protein
MEKVFCSVGAPLNHGTEVAGTTDGVVSKRSLLAVVVHRGVRL